MWYAIIFVLSLVSLFILPMIGAEVGLAMILPNTVAGWIVWSVANLTSALLNVLLYHSFIKQGKLNIKDDPNYLAANELLRVNNLALVERPRSPQQYLRSLYRKKGTTIFIFTVLGTISFSHAILTFSAIKFLAQLITLLMGLICGLFQMKGVEEFWTIEYPEYAKLVVKEKEEKEQLLREAEEVAAAMVQAEQSTTTPIKEETNYVFIEEHPTPQS